MTLTERLSTLDRRWLFLTMAVVVSIPILIRMDLAPEPSNEVRRIHGLVEALPDGAVVLVSVDYDPGSEAELHPMTLALFHQLAAKKVRLLVTQLWNTGSPLADRALELAYLSKGKVYGEDVVNLGYKPGSQIVVTKMVESIRGAYPTDRRRRPLAEYPMMKDIHSLKDVDFFFIISAGTPGTKEWLQQCQGKIGKPMATGVTAVSAPEFLTYVGTHQLVGILGGLRGAADYEKLVGHEGRGVRGMGSQTFGHLLIVVFIVLGNLGYLVGRRKKARG
jgi:hypothetical protein